MSDSSEMKGSPLDAPSPRRWWHRWTEPQAPFMRQWLAKRHCGFWRYAVAQGLFYATLGAVGGVAVHLALRQGVTPQQTGSAVDLAVVVAIAFLLVAATLGPMLWHWCRFTAQRRWRQGVCPNCCYDIRATLAHGGEGCPECGITLTQFRGW